MKLKLNNNLTTKVLATTLAVSSLTLVMPQKVSAVLKLTIETPGGVIEVGDTVNIGFVLSDVGTVAPFGLDFLLADFLYNDSLIESTTGIFTPTANDPIPYGFSSAGVRPGGGSVVYDPSAFPPFTVDEPLVDGLVGTFEFEALAAGTAEFIPLPSLVTARAYLFPGAPAGSGIPVDIDFSTPAFVEIVVPASVPEPLTILGTATALGVGALFKKKKLSQAE